MTTTANNAPLPKRLTQSINDIPSNRNDNIVYFLTKIVRSRRLHDPLTIQCRTIAKEYINTVKSSKEPMSQSFLDNCFDLYSRFRKQQDWLDMTPDQRKAETERLYQQVEKQQQDDLWEWILGDD